MAKVQIFHPQIIAAFRLFPESSRPIIARFSMIPIKEVFEINFSSCYTTNVISETFNRLLLNRSLKTCLALQCIRVVVCSTAFFFTKVSLPSKNFYWNPAKMSFQETFDINYYYYHYCHCTFIYCWQKKDSDTFLKKAN